MLQRYDIGKMKVLLESFHKLTGIPITLFGSDFSRVVFATEQYNNFCHLIRRDEIANQKCLDSDHYACQKCRELNQLYAHTCHAGLTEIVTPIRYGNLIIGYLMFGQVLEKCDKDEYWEVVKSRCAEYPVDMDELHFSYNRLQMFDKEQLNAAAKVLEACAGYLWLERTIYLEEDDMASKIERYIESNLNANLSVASLCSEFGVGRSKLYKLAQKFFGCGIEQLIRNIRIQKAKELLIATNSSVGEIAYAMGFQDYSYFIKVFKKEVGETPLQYRKLGANLPQLKVNGYHYYPL